jgi:hypothetical protein
MNYNTTFQIYDKALKAMYEILKMGRMYKLSIKCLLDLFDKMIKHILLYGCAAYYDFHSIDDIVYTIY